MHRSCATATARQAADEDCLDSGGIQGELEQLLADTFETFRREAFAYSMSILKEADLAEDAVQMAFIELLRRIQAGDAEFFRDAPWEAVKRNVRWSALKLRRELGLAERWFSPLDDEPSSRTDTFSAVEQQVVVKGILEQLPGHMRQVLRMRAYDDEPDAVNAARLGITLDAFRCRYKRALTAARTVARGIGLETACGFMVLLPFRARRRFRAVVSRGADRVNSVATRLAQFVRSSDLALRGPAAEALGLAAVVAVGLSAAAPTLPSAATTARTSPPSAPASGLASTMWVQPSRVSRGGATPAASPGLKLPAVAPASGPVLTLAGSGATSETPEDTSFYTVTSSPSAQHRQWMVALGWGNTCGCPVLFQSQDGGATWSAAPGPTQNSGSQATLTLPPSYPDDPRIFVSAPASLGAPTVMADRFGAPFLPLPVPPGSIALSPSFEGDSRIFVNGGSQAWSYNTAQHLLRPIVFPGVVSQVLALSAPVQAGADDLYALADATVPATTLATGGVNGLTLYGCSSNGTCAAISAPPLPAANSLSLSPSFSTDRTLEVAWVDRVAVSHDNGNTFEVIEEPASASSVLPTFLGAGPNNAPSVWGIVHAASGPALMRLDPSVGQWQPVLDAAHAGGHPPEQADVVGTRLLALLRGGGFACSVDGGLAWAPRCPA